MNRLADSVVAYTDDQAHALWEARLRITEDGDTAGILVVDTDHTIKLDQLDPEGRYVRTWITRPDGHLTWIN
jgi:hypothetical protein